jgi:hypothetical protein
MKREQTEEQAKWRGLVSEQVASGQSVAVFCRDRGLRDWQFYEWKKRLREAEAAKFVAVEVAQTAETKWPAAVAHSGAIEVWLCRGRSLMVEPGFDAHHLLTLLSVLEAEA